MDPSEGQTKQCSTCKAWKPLGEFNKRSTAPDGHQWMCRECNKAYHYKNHARHMAQITARRRRETAANQRRLLEYLLEHPCVDCGESDPVVLEFDHLRDKTKSISELLIGYSWTRILREIDKCEVVCCNCHRRRTLDRQGAWRVTGVFRGSAEEAGEAAS